MPLHCRRKYLELLTSFLLFILSSAIHAHNGEEAYTFIKNEGQWPKNVKYRVDLVSGYLFLEEDRLTYLFYDYSELTKWHGKSIPKDFDEEIILKKHIYQIHFKEKSSLTSIIPLEESAQYYNFFLGPREQWAGHVLGYQKVVYQNIYDKIDLIFYTKDGLLKYDFVVHPGANLSDVQLAYKGVDDLKIKNNEFYIRTSVNTTIEEEPFSYQIIKDQEKVLPCKFKLNNKTLSFQILEKIDNTVPLIIDPTLIFSTYSGSYANNFGMSATYDDQGHLYAGGTAFGPGYDTTLGAFQETFNGSTGNGITDVVISKYTPDGTSMIYSTYLGGNSSETVHSMIVNENDELFVYGATASTDFPVTSNAYQQNFAGGSNIYFQTNGSNFVGGTDIYITRFNNTGSGLLGSTYLGGSKNDGINYNASNVELYDSLMFNYGDQFRGEIMLDDQSNCYIASSTRSDDFPVVNGFDQSFNGVQDAIIAKLTPDLSNLEWCSYIGGEEKDAGFSVKVDESYNVYVTGGTASLGFPTTVGALNTNYQGGKADAYVMKIDASGNNILNASYLGTNQYDQAFFLEIDRFNDIYLLGQSLGNMPVSNVNYSNPNSKQFITKLNNTIDNIIYSTLFGNGNGTVNFSPSAFLVDRCQNVYISGWGGNILGGAAMINMPTTSDAWSQNAIDGYDYYFAVFEQDFEGIIYGTYFGGNLSEEHVDGGTSRFDKKGIVYQSVCAGCWNNDDFPSTAGAWSSTNNAGPGACNNGVFKFDFEVVVTASFSSSDTSACGPTMVNLINESQGGDLFYWDYGNGLLDTTNQDTSIIYTEGSYIVTLIAHDTICDIQDTIQKSITIFPPLDLDGSTNASLCEADTVEFIANSEGTADYFIWSTSANFNDTLNSSILDSTLNYFVSENDTLYVLVVSGICQLSDTVQVQLNTFDALEDSSMTTCGNCIGSATITPLNSSYTYVYQWNDLLNQNTAMADSLCVGNYQVTVTNEFGCYKEFEVEITDSSDIQIAFEETVSNLCFEDCNAALLANVVGGTAPYTYQWSTSVIDTLNTLTQLCSGNYILTVADSVNCLRVGQVNILHPNELVLLNSELSHVTCHDSCDGSINLNLSGGVQPYTILWNDPNNQTGGNLVNVCAGAFTVEIIDSNGCSLDTSFMLVQPAPFSASISSSPPLCFNNCIGYIEAHAEGGEAPYEYQWGQNQLWSEDSAVSNLCPGSYAVTIRDSNLCAVRDTVVISTTTFSSFPVNLSVDNDTIVQYQSTVLHAFPEGEGVFQWSPAEYLSNPNVLHPTASPLDTITFTFTVRDSANLSCKFDSSITIYVVDYICDDPSIFIPNAFTPNNDQNNDVLYVRGLKLSEFYFTVYNRWGEVVFETSDPNIGWDGIYNGKESDPGVFDYYLRATCPNQEKIFLKGNVTLIR